jgi:deazaflavin-dependent oxidoreductase (nitroreductase family)
MDTPAPRPSRLAVLGGRLLRTRWLVRSPIWLYRARLGFLLGDRFCMIEHIGRTSGARRYVVVEVFGHPEPGTYLVVSGFGTGAQWYRNLAANPAARLWVGGRPPAAVTAVRLDDAEADAAFEVYVTRYARAWQKFRPVIEDTLGRPVERGADLPILALRRRTAEG